MQGGHQRQELCGGRSRSGAARNIAETSSSQNSLKTKQPQRWPKTRKTKVPKELERQLLEHIEAQGVT